MNAAAALSGFVLGLGLITPIGAQNAHVLRTAVRAPRRAVLVVVGMVITSDVVLIGLGAAGAGAILDHSDVLRLALYAAGVGLLVPLGVRAIRDGVRGTNSGYDEVLAEEAGPPTAHSAALGRAAARAVVVPTLVVSLLNPHVIIDTVAILGGAVSAAEPPDRLSFTLGAMLASAVWFSGLALIGAVVLRRYGSRMARGIGILGGIVMLVVAAVLTREAIHTLLDLV